MQKVKIIAAKYGCSILLCSIVFWQMYLVKTQDLTVWKGGGFGMFSTVDSLNTRFTRVVLVTETEEFLVPVPSFVRTVDVKSVSIPTEENLEKLATRLANMKWVKREYFSEQAYNRLRDVGEKRKTYSWSSIVNQEFHAIKPSEYKQSQHVIPVVAVRVEHWRYRFDSEGKNISIYKVKHAVKEVKK